MKKTLTIIIYNGSFHLPTFVYQLGAQLTKKGHHVTFMGQSDTCFPYSKGQMRYYPLPYTDQTLWLFLKSWLMALQLVFKRPLALPGIWRTLKADYHKNKGKKGRKNWVMDFIRLGACQLIKPDVIHNQWSTALEALGPLFHYYPIVQSLHGVLEDVKPAYIPKVNEIYKAFFPKVSGFQSDSNQLLQTITPYGPLSKNTYVSHALVEHKRLVNNLPDPQTEQKFKLLSIGKFIWRKGFVHALEGLSILNQKGYDVEYTIIGWGEPLALHFHIKDLGLENQVNLLKNRSQDEVFEALNHHQVFLLPSEEEGFATVVTEAMARGKPVISTDCGGMRELLKDGHNAWLIPSRDPRAISLAIEDYLHATPKKINGIQKNARNLVKNDLIWENQVDNFVKLYQKAAS